MPTPSAMPVASAVGPWLSLANAQMALSCIFYIFGIGGVCLAYFTLRANRQNQRESNARRAYLDYAQLGIEYPKFAFPHLLKLDFDNQTADGSRVEFEKYEWFVSMVLGTVRFFLEFVGNKTMWRSMMILQLAYHWEYLERYRGSKEYLKRWTEELGDELAEAIALGSARFNKPST